jgi:hypothetical protein
LENKREEIERLKRLEKLKEEKEKKKAQEHIEKSLAVEKGQEDKSIEEVKASS